MAQQSFDIDVTGLTCGSCVKSAESAMTQVEGVATASVNLATGRARLDLATSAQAAATLREVAQALTKAGYPAATQSLQLELTGVTCGSCISRVESALNSVPGVLSASANLSLSRAQVEILASAVGVDSLTDAIGAAGYGASLVDADNTMAADQADSVQEQERLGLRRQLMIAAAFTLPLVIVAMGRHLPGGHGLYTQFLPERAWIAIEWLLATPVVFWAGRGFFVRGFKEMRHAAPAMSSLVMVGAGAAYAYSLLVLVVPAIFPAGTAGSYFEASGVIITLILLGHKQQQ
jgi:Cu+-exporting ATPase